MSRDGVDRVFEGLAHPTRRRILDLLFARPGRNVREVAAEFSVSRIAVLKHLKMLESCGLIHSEKIGRERRLYMNLAPIQLVYDRWTDRYGGFWAQRVADLKERLESRAERKAVDRAG